MSARKTPDERRRSRTISCSNNEWGELEAGAIAEARHTGRRSVSVSDFLVNAGLARAEAFKPEPTEPTEPTEPPAEEAGQSVTLDFGAAVLPVEDAPTKEADAPPAA